MSYVEWTYYGPDGAYSGTSSLPNGVGPFPPPGHTARMGRYGERTRIVNDQVVAMPDPTPEEVAEQASERIRNLRDHLLAETDWLAARASDGAPIPQEWRAYRQALRDIPQQGGFPLSVSWPTKPI